MIHRSRLHNDTHNFVLEVARGDLPKACTKKII